MSIKLNLSWERVKPVSGYWQRVFKCDWKGRTQLLDKYAIEVRNVYCLESAYIRDTWNHEYSSTKLNVWFTCQGIGHTFKA